MSYKFGPKIVFLISMLIGSIGTILVPVVANWSVSALFVFRFLTGLAQVRSNISLKLVDYGFYSK